MYMKQTADRAVSPVVLPGAKIDFGKIMRPLKFVAILLALLAAAYAGTQYFKHLSTIETTDDAYVTGHVNMVSSRVAGVVKSVVVKDNQFVKAGEVMIQLDPADFQVNVNNEIAALEKARSQSDAAHMNVDYSSSKAGAMKSDAVGAISASESAIERAKAALTQAKAGVPMAHSTLKQRESELHLAKLNFERLRMLRKQGAISQQDLDTSAKDRDVAEAASHSASEAVRQAESQVLMAEQGVMDAQAQLVRSKASLDNAQAQTVQTVVDQHEYSVSQAAIGQAKAKLDAAKLQLSYTKIVAPVSGRVGRKTVEIGQHVQAGQALLAVVPEELWIVANFKETQLRKMKIGQPVLVKIDALGDETVIKGKVDSFAPGSGSQFALLPPDNATGNFTKIVQRIPVKIAFDQNSLNSEISKKIIPGMSAEVEVELQ